MVLFVPPSSGTLIFRRLASELPRCQNGTESGLAAVSLSEVGERPIERAVSLSADNVGRIRPTGLLDAADDGQSWYLDGAAGCCKLRSEGLFSSCGRGGSLVTWRFLSDLERRGACWFMDSRVWWCHRTTYWRLGGLLRYINARSFGVVPHAMGNVCHGSRVTDGRGFAVWSARYMRLGRRACQTCGRSLQYNDGQFGPGEALRELLLQAVSRQPLPDQRYQ